MLYLNKNSKLFGIINFGAPLNPPYSSSIFCNNDSEYLLKSMFSKLFVLDSTMLSELIPS